MNRIDTGVNRVANWRSPLWRTRLFDGESSQSSQSWYDIELGLTCKNYFRAFSHFIIYLRIMYFLYVINKYTQDMIEFVLYKENLPIVTITPSTLKSLSLRSYRILSCYGPLTLAGLTYRTTLWLKWFNWEEGIMSYHNCCVMLVVITHANTN